MMIPEDVFDLLENSRRKIIVLQWLGVGVGAVLGPPVLLFSPWLTFGGELPLKTVLILGGMFTLLFIGALIETLRMLDSFRQVTASLQAPPGQIVGVALDKRPVRGVVIPKVRIRLANGRKATYPLDAAGAQRVMEVLEGRVVTSADRTS